VRPFLNAGPQPIFSTPYALRTSGSAQFRFATPKGYGPSTSGSRVGCSCEVIKSNRAPTFGDVRLGAVPRTKSLPKLAGRVDITFGIARMHRLASPREVMHGRLQR